MVAATNPHLTGVTFDLPPVAPVAAKNLAHLGVTDRVTTAVGDFFTDPFPPADIYFMGNILHDWNEEQKQALISEAFQALPAGGILVAVENIIDDDRRTNSFGLLMSLNMLIEPRAGAPSQLRGRDPTLNRNWKVPHFDGKGQADAVFADLGLPTTWIRASFYRENLIRFGMGPEGVDDHFTITFHLGDRSLAGIAVEDIGKTALGIFKAGDRHVGQTLGIMGEALTGNKMATQLSDALDVKIIYNAVTPDTYQVFGFRGAEDLGNMFQTNRDFEAEYLANRDVALTRELNPELKTFQAWLKRYAKDIPLQQQ